MSDPTVKRWLLSFDPDPDNYASTFEPVLCILATEDDIESLVYEHHRTSGAFFKHTVRHWCWREIQLGEREASPPPQR